jgi:peptide/nickel transport system substrate-binding protein
MLKQVLTGSLAALALLLAPLTPQAATLTEGIQVEPDSIDPHFHWFGGNLNISFQIFEPLVQLSGDGALQPALASSWKALDDQTWEFVLRPGVTFHDGTPLTAADVAFTYRRAPTVPQSPGGFGPYLRHVTSIETPDATRLIVHTDGAVPLLPTYLSRIGIISRHAGQDAATQDYNSGKAAIGTGPYRFVSWARGASITLARNEAYWGARSEWETVQTRFIANAASRIAALRSGDVDIIDAVSVEDVAGLKQNPAFHVVEQPASNIIALQLDVAHRAPPFITGPHGEALQTNPLADLRVRQALSMAINRAVLKDRVMNGEMAIATQPMAPGQFGYDPSFTPLPYDPAKARQLLTEAGYPDGFRMTMQCQADRFANGAGLCQAAAQMLTRIGVKADPTPMPHSMFIGHANKHEYSFFTLFMLMDTAEPGQALSDSFSTPEPGKIGGFNRGQYSNPAFDALLETAAHQVDPVQREATLRQAVHVIGTDIPFIPLLRPLNIEAMRAGLAHAARNDGFIFAASVHTAGN